MTWKETGPPGGARRALENDASVDTFSTNNATHYSRPTVEPQDIQPIGKLAAEIVADLTFRRDVERVHRLGARVMAELLAEIGAERMIQTSINRKIQHYAELDRSALEALGGDDFWPVPLYLATP